MKIENGELKMKNGEAKMKNVHNFTFYILHFTFIAALAAFTGCTVYRGGKIVEGTDIAAGVSLPSSGGQMQIDALNFLTGFRFLFADNAGIVARYSTTNSVKAFGCYESTTMKTIDIELNPTVDEPENGELRMDN